MNVLCDFLALVSTSLAFLYSKLSDILTTNYLNRIKVIPARRVASSQTFAQPYATQFFVESFLLQTLSSLRKF